MQAQEPGLVETCLQGFSGEDFPSDPSAIQGENIFKKKRGSVADQDGICFDAVQCSQGIPMHLQYLCVCVCVSLGPCSVVQNHRIGRRVWGRQDLSPTSCLNHFGFLAGLIHKGGN